MDATPTRDRLLDAAAAVFLEHGYSRASMDQVRQAAGVSNGSLYHHFPTKAELADALYVQTLHAFHGALLAAIKGDVDAETGIKGMVRAYVTWVVRHPDRAALLHKLKREGDVTDASAGISAANAEAFSALQSWTEAQRAAGHLRDLPFHLWMALVFSPAMSLTARWVKDARPSVPPKVRAALEHAAWMAVAP